MKYFDEKYVFISYQLGPTIDSPESTYMQAKEIGEKLKNMGVSYFLRDPYDSSKSYSDTPNIAQGAFLFLLVANKFIDKKCVDFETGTGNIIRQLKNDCYIYEEIEAYLNQYQGKSAAAKGRIQCFCLDEDYENLMVENLHKAYHQMVPIRNYAQLTDWVNKLYVKAENNCEKCWNAELATVWENMYAPSRPSSSEIECYKKLFQKAKKNASGDRPCALIMGSTPEFRELAADMGFEIFVVDYNKEYYEEISKLVCDSTKKDEKLFVYDWANMGDHLQGRMFDIIIGDLAIGNIPPDNLDKVITSVCKLLRKDGYFLGKNLYSFSREEISEDVIVNIISNYFNSSEEDTPERAYACTMYALSIYATQERRGRRINFDLIYKKVNEICEKFEKKDSYLYQIYCGENTSFKEKMELNFYTYPIHEIIEMLQKGLCFIDTDYGVDIYSHKFPLLIFQKQEGKPFNIEAQKHECFTKIKNYILSLTKQDKIKNWSKYIAAQYFIGKISEIFPDLVNTQWKGIFQTLKENIISTIKVKISEDLVCYVDSYDDERIKNETERIKNVMELQENQDKLIADTYTLAVLVYLTSFLSPNYQSLNSVFNLVSKKLFDIPVTDLWQPEEAPWVRAKICLAVLRIYNKEFKKEYKEKIEATIDWIINNYNQKSCDWKCAVGSHLDTKALCCEVLLSYYPIIEKSTYKYNILYKLYEILKAYVLGGKIYETCALYPIGECVITHIIQDDSLNGKPFGKKLTARVEFLTVLLRIINFAKENFEIFKKEGFSIDESNLDIAENFLTRRLIDFWDLFAKNSNNLVEHLATSEISAVLQIIYSMLEAFQEKNV